MSTDGAIAVFVGLAAGWFLREVAGFVLKAKLQKHQDVVLRLLNRKIFPVALGLIGIACTVYVAFVFFNSNAPATRKDVLLGLSMVVFLFVVVVNLGDDVVQWGRRFRDLGGVKSVDDPQ